MSYKLPRPSEHRFTVIVDGKAVLSATASQLRSLNASHQKPNETRVVITKPATLVIL